MLHLILDSSGQFAQWILADAETPLAHMQSQEVFDASAQILPLLDQLLNQQHIHFKDIHYLSYVAGPGSFTGLRIAASALKALAFAQNKKITALNPMQMLAQQRAQQQSSPNILCPVIASRRDHVYLAAYQNNVSTLTCIQATQEYPIKDLSALTWLDPSCLFLGPDAQLLSDHFNKLALDPISPQSFIQQAYTYIKTQNFEDLAHFQPNYIVQSVAKPKHKR